VPRGLPSRLRFDDRHAKKSLTFEFEPVILYPQSIQTQPEGEEDDTRTDSTREEPGGHKGPGV